MILGTSQRPAGQEIPCLTRNAGILTAATGLLAATARASAAGALDVRRFDDDVELRAWLPDFLREQAQREILAVTHGNYADLATFAAAHQVNLEFVARGVRMLSVFDYTQTAVEGPPELLPFLAASLHVTYLTGYGPVQVKVVDRDVVILEAPRPPGERRGLATSTSRDLIAAAMRYLGAVRDSSVPVTALTPPAGALSGRQLLVGSLLAEGADDSHIAQAIGVSIRTVRYEIAHICRELGAPTRFAAGAAFARAIHAKAN